jgi:hypothetical protein
MKESFKMATETLTATMSAATDHPVRELVATIAKALEACPAELRNQAHANAVAALDRHDAKALVQALEPGFQEMGTQRQLEAINSSLAPSGRMINSETLIKLKMEAHMDQRHVNIFLLPTAYETPIAQKPVRGRHPKCVVSMREFKRRKLIQEADKRLIEEEIAMLKHLTNIEKNNIGPYRASRLRLLTEPCVTPRDKAALKQIIDDLRWLALPFEVRQSIEAWRAGRGKVLQLESQ